MSRMQMGYQTMVRLKEVTFSAVMHMMAMCGNIIAESGMKV